MSFNKDAKLHELQEENDKLRRERTSYKLDKEAYKGTIDKLEEIRIACGGDDGFMITSCCGYELMYKKVGQYSFELWDFCGMCLKSSWEPVTEDDYLKDNPTGVKLPEDLI